MANRSNLSIYFPNRNLFRDRLYSKPLPREGLRSFAPLLLWRLGNPQAVALAYCPQSGVGSDQQTRPWAVTAPFGRRKSFRIP